MTKFPVTEGRPVRPRTVGLARRVGSGGLVRPTAAGRARVRLAQWVVAGLLGRARVAGPGRLALT